MKTISRASIPADYTYYRTGSRVFYDYYTKYTKRIVQKTWKWNEFYTALRMFPGFWNITVEKQDEELDREDLKKLWISHGIIFWTPLRKMQKPKWWLRLPTWFTRWNIHSSRSAFSILDRADYWNKWSSKARAHRRNVLKNIEIGKIRIDATPTVSDFLELYKTSKVSDPNRSSVARLTKKLFSGIATPCRVYIVYLNNQPLAWAIFIDEWVTSEYWASFYHKSSYPYHLGIAMMDRWFLDSYEKWIQYCDLDHMRDDYQSFGYAGYTKFKESIADHDVYFHDTWVKFF